MRKRMRLLEFYDTLGMALFGVIVIALQTNEYLHTHVLNAFEIIGVASGMILVVLGVTRFIRMHRHV